MPLEETIRAIIAFRDERNWKKYHSPKNLANALSVEASELVEIFQWVSDAELEDVVKERKEDIQDEIADVLIYALTLAHDLGLDVCKIISQKIEKNHIKHPIESD
jgi:NTP pyrophosphatase (non-canonical NTP hydrolase)